MSVPVEEVETCRICIRRLCLTHIDDILDDDSWLRQLRQNIPQLEFSLQNHDCAGKCGRSTGTVTGYDGKSVEHADQEA